MLPMRGLVDKLRRPQNAGTPLEQALRRVTHTNCAAVPSEAVHEAVSLATESEESLALVLRHVEENVNASASDWRRIHGSLALLERLVRPGAAARTPTNSSGRHDSFSESLIGRMWYEAKIEARLKNLLHFECPDDPRVANLIRRAATSTMNAVEKYIPANDEENMVESSESRSRARWDNDSDTGYCGGGGSGTPGDNYMESLERACTGGSCGTARQRRVSEEPKPIPASTSPSQKDAVRSNISPKLKDAVRSSIPPTPIGRPSFHLNIDSLDQDLEASIQIKNNNLRNATSALDALRETSTRWEPPKAAVVEKACSPNVDSERPSAGCCWCCRRRSAKSEQAEAPGENEDDSLLL